MTAPIYFNGGAHASTDPEFVDICLDLANHSLWPRNMNLLSVYLYCPFRGHKTLNGSFVWRGQAFAFITRSSVEDLDHSIAHICDIVPSTDNYVTKHPVSTHDYPSSVQFLKYNLMKKLKKDSYTQAKTLEVLETDLAIFEPPTN